MLGFISVGSRSGVQGIGIGLAAAHLVGLGLDEVVVDGDDRRDRQGLRGSPSACGKRDLTPRQVTGPHTATIAAVVVIVATSDNVFSITAAA